jgi:ArsR family transcriptional regulator, arsenate/arsenite/antimonite-responsive transcriptional repressor
MTAGAAPTMSTEISAGHLRLFADPLRLRIIELLATEDLCTCHLVAETGAKQPTVSHHLRLLREAGIVEAEPDGAYTYYGLLPQALLGLGAALTELGRTAARPVRRRPTC